MQVLIEATENFEEDKEERGGEKMDPGGGEAEKVEKRQGEEGRKDQGSERREGGKDSHRSIRHILLSVFP